MMEALKDQLECVEKYIILCEKSEMPETLKMLFHMRNILNQAMRIMNGQLEDDAACGLCYTSGTTGNPKGVLYAHKSNILHAQAALTGLTVSPDESILMVVPLFMFKHGAYHIMDQCLV